MQEDILKELAQKPRKLLIKCECGHYHSIDEIAIVEYLVGKNCDFDPSKVVKDTEAVVESPNVRPASHTPDWLPNQVPVGKTSHTWGGSEVPAVVSASPQPTQQTSGAVPNKVKKVVIPPSFQVGDKTISGMSMFVPPPELRQ